MFGDPNLDIRITEAGRNAERARHGMERNTDNVKALEKKVDSLSVVCLALMELLHEHTSCTDEQFQIKMDELKERSVTESKCKQCGRMKSTRTDNCPYCGVIVSSSDE